MKLTKQEEVLLNSNPLGFMVYAYLGLHPDTKVRELADLTSPKRTKCHELMRKYRQTDKVTDKVTDKQSPTSKGRATSRTDKNTDKNTDKQPIITTQATETPRDNGLHQAFVQTFDEYYKHITGYAYNWDAKAMGGIKQLIQKITSDTKAVNPTASPEEIANNFKMFLSIISDNWILNNLSPTLLNSKYNEIKATYGRAKQGNNTNTKHGLSPLEQFQQAIRNRKR